MLLTYSDGNPHSIRDFSGSHGLRGNPYRLFYAGLPSCNVRMHSRTERGNEKSLAVANASRCRAGFVILAIGKLVQ